MSWIKDNKFLAALGGGTLVGVILLYLVGAQASKRYTAASEEYASSAAQATEYEKQPLYPRQDLRDGKRKAIDEYKKSVDSLQKAFEPFRKKELENSTPQEFTNRLLAAKDETQAAFVAAGTVVPEEYFMGFEAYRTSLAGGANTGLLNYQLDGIKKLMLELAKAKPTELKNLHRPALPEETNQEYTPAPGDVARSFPLEIVFVAPEKTAREFLSSIVKVDDGKYAVIRSLRIANAKKTPPTSTDAQFEQAATATPSAPAGEAESSGGFVFPGEEETPAEDTAAAPAAAPAAAAGDSSKILSQVLGNEEVQVFVRLDILNFLEEKKLP